MGSSQFKSFLACEARTMAELRGEYSKEKTPALLIGSYVDAYFSDELDLFRKENPKTFRQDGKLKAEYQHAERIIRRIEADPMFMKYLSGKKQVVRCGTIDGVPFKIKMDVYHAGKAIVDLKILRDFAPVYRPGEGRLTFVEAWGYDIQGAIYQAVEGNQLPFFLAAATKEKEPDLKIIRIDQPYLDTAMALIKANVSRFDAVKKGLIEPKRCERCDYCKRTKRLTKIDTMEDLTHE